MSQVQDGSLLEGKAREEYVSRMFDRIAGPYDRLNRIISLGRDGAWRRRAVQLARVGTGMSVADLGTGTGDFYRLLARRVGPEGHVVGIDIAPQMLEVARRKIVADQPTMVPDLRVGSAATTGLADASVEVVSMAWVLRNVGDRQAAYSEILRILKPGGRFVCIDMSTPDVALFKLGARMYMRLFMPLVVRIAGGDRDAYEYLDRSTRRFPGRRELEAEWRASGFENVTSRALMLGAVAIHVGERS